MLFQTILGFHDKGSGGQQRCLGFTNPVLNLGLVLKRRDGTPGCFLLCQFYKRIDSPATDAKGNRCFVIDGMGGVSERRIFPDLARCQGSERKQMFRRDIAIRHSYIVAAGPSHSGGVPCVHNLEFAARHHEGRLRGLPRGLVDGHRAHQIVPVRVLTATCK